MVCWCYTGHYLYPTCTHSLLDGLLLHVLNRMSDPSSTHQQQFQQTCLSETVCPTSSSPGTHCVSNTSSFRSGQESLDAMSSPAIAIDDKQEPNHKKPDELVKSVKHDHKRLGKYEPLNSPSAREPSMAHNPQKASKKRSIIGPMLPTPQQHKERVKELSAEEPAKVLMVGLAMLMHKKKKYYFTCRVSRQILTTVTGYLLTVSTLTSQN